jgi:NADH:ubiquinone oxidoreductase subunit 6 (chain J)
MLIAAVKIARSRNPVYAVISLIILFCLGATLILLKGMEFHSLLHIIIYIGALSVLFLFIIMLLNISLTEIVTYRRFTFYAVAQGFLVWAFSCAVLYPGTYSAGGLQGQLTAAEPALTVSQIAVKVVRSIPTPHFL